MYSGNRQIILSVLFIIIAGFVVLGWVGFTISDRAAVVENFEQCVAVGNPIMESHPRHCRSAENYFAEDVVDEMEGLVLTLN